MSPLAMSSTGSLSSMPDELYQRGDVPQTVQSVARQNRTVCAILLSAADWTVCATLLLGADRTVCATLHSLRYVSMSLMVWCG